MTHIAASHATPLSGEIDQSLAPDFLVITPPKTGSHWLAANLSCHPEIFVPRIKEVKYFSSTFKWFDLAWYYDQFRPGLGKVKGEASPTYAFLPRERIERIRELLPNLKLIYLMREPIARAWSHAKHNYRYREANFASCTAEFSGVAAEQWQENFVNDWPYASGDYLGHLQRWLAVFPRDQIYVGFYESIVSQPEALLRGLFRFLGVAADIDLSAFPVRQKVFAGMEANLAPDNELFLHRLFHERTTRLASFLSERFGLEPPASWRPGLEPRRNRINNECNPHAADFDDARLAQILTQEETFPSAPVSVLEGYRGHNILFYRGNLYALQQELGASAGEGLTENDLQRFQANGTCIAASTLAEIKDRVDRPGGLRRLLAKWFW